MLRIPSKMLAIKKDFWNRASRLWENQIYPLLSTQISTWTEPEALYEKNHNGLLFNASNEYFWPKIFLIFMHGWRSAILAIFENSEFRPRQCERGRSQATFTGRWSKTVPLFPYSIKGGRWSKKPNSCQHSLWSITKVFCDNYV